MKLEQAAQFVKHLESLRDDRAALAALRRGLGKPPGTAMEMFPHVIPYVPSEHAQRACFLVAALFAAYPDAKVWGENLGASFAQLPNRDSAQRRFVALLRAESDELPTHLRHAIALLKAHDIPISWERLLCDIDARAWERPQRYVQQQWGRSFWTAPTETTDTNDEDTSTMTKEDASA